MTWLLDPRAWLAALGVAALAGLAGYWQGHRAADLSYKAKAADNLAKQVADERALRASLDNAVIALAKEKKRAQELDDRLRNRVRTGELRLSVPVLSCPGAPIDPTLGDREARAELDRSAAEALVRIAQDGDDAIRELNSCIDRYNALRIER